jgi:proteic killer suppression protein
MVTRDDTIEVRYYPFPHMIASFKDADTKLLYETGKSPRIPAGIRRVAMRKLVILDKVQRLEYLRIPPANHLEALTGDRAGQHSILINDQFRLCFVWREGDAFDVEIVDYH